MMENRFDTETNSSASASGINRFDTEDLSIGQGESGVDFSAMKMASNFPGSAVNIAKDTAQSVMHPVETAISLGGVAESGVEQLGRKLAEFTTGSDIAPREGKEDQINAVSGYFKERYGSVDGFKTALMEDPAGVLLDFAGAGIYSKIPKVAKIAKFGEMGTALKTVMPKNVVEKLYQSAAKFNLSNKVTPEVRKANLNTAVEYGIMPTTEGFVKAESMADVLNGRIDQAIKSHPPSQGLAPGNAIIPVDTIFQHFSDLRKDLLNSANIDAIKELKQINKFEADYRAQWKGRTHITLEQLQTFKKDAYTRVTKWGDKKQGKMKATETAARGAKDEIARQIPSVADINRQLSELYKLQPGLRTAANRVDKAPVVPLGAKLTGAAAIGGAAWLGSPVLGITVAFAEALMANAKFRAKMAITINQMKGSKAGKFINDNINTPEVRIALAMAGRAEESAEQLAAEQESN